MRVNSGSSIFNELMAHDELWKFEVPTQTDGYRMDVADQDNSDVVDKTRRTFLSSFNDHLVGDQQYLVDGFSEATPPRDWPMSEASRSRCDPGSKSS